MPVTLAEFQLRKRLPKRSLILLFDAACLLGWTSIKAVAELAGVKYDHARVQLGKLVREGWLHRETDAQLGLLRYTARVAPLESGDRSPKIGQPIARDRSDRSPEIGRPISQDRPLVVDARASDPDLSSDRDPIDQRVRPSGEVQEGTDARTEGNEVRQSDVQWIAEQWRVSGTIAHRMAAKLLELGLERRELREYLEAARRGTHTAFIGLERAEYPLGAACTSERVDPWRASRAPRPKVVDAEPRRVRRPVSAVSAREMEDFVRNKLRR
jgi:hypothetical protein